MNNESKKIKSEREILKRAHSLLEKLYGVYDPDKNQTDRPDAAIDVTCPRKQVARDRKPIKVGIEITTVDPKEYLAYFKDEKHGKDLKDAELETLIKYNRTSGRAEKKEKITITSTFIYDGVKNKAKLYESYNYDGVYREVILLCYTEILLPTDEFLKDLVDWSNYYMSVNNYPFDKVIFLAGDSFSAIKVYDRKTPLRDKSLLRKWSNKSVCIARGILIPADTSFNIYDSFSNGPIIKPKSKKKT